jgi:nucleoside-diphosphate-sugar epimerase
MDAILVLGSQGFLGSKLVEVLSKKYFVFGLTREHIVVNNTKYNVNEEQSKLRNIIDEFSSIIVINAIVNYSKITSSYSIIESSIYDNIFAPINSLKLFEEKISIFINSSSFFVKHKELNNSHSFYTKQKDLSHYIFREYFELKNIRYTNCIIHHVYGNNDNERKFIPNVVKKIKSGEKEIVLSACLEKRDFIHVNDVASAFLFIVEKMVGKNLSLSEVEIGTGKSITVRSFIEKLTKTSESRSRIKFSESSLKNQIEVAKISNKTLFELGWRPETSIDNGIKSLL